MRGSWDLLEMTSYRFLWTTFNILEYGKFLDAQLVRFEDTPAEADRGYLLRLPVPPAPPVPPSCPRHSSCLESLYIE